MNLLSLQFRYIVTLVIILLFAPRISFTQVNFAEDFTHLDTDGIEHNLYDLLDEGKYVVIDIFATWCEPCWGFHQSETLKDVWNELGPNGTNEVFVFGMESDVMTTYDNLVGIGDATLGNWLEGVPYPTIEEIFDLTNSSFFGPIASTFEPFGYPTTILICPDRTYTTEFWELINVESISERLGSCAGTIGNDNIGIISYLGTEGDFCSEQNFAPSVMVQNFGANDITSIEASLLIDGAIAQSVEQTLNLTSFQIDTLFFDEVTLSNNDFEITVSTVNGNADEDISNNSYLTSVNSPPVTSFDSVDVEILTDNWGADTYWRIIDDNGAIISEGGNLLVNIDSTINTTGVELPFDESQYESNQLYVTRVGLPSVGCYEFIIADYFEDGICCSSGAGNYNIKSQDGKILLEGAEFNHISKSPFSYNGAVSTYDFGEKNELIIYPNPVQDFISFDFGDLQDVKSVQIIDLNGKIIYSAPHTVVDGFTIDTGALSKGLYITYIYFTDGHSLSQKFIKI